MEVLHESVNKEQQDHNCQVTCVYFKINVIIYEIINVTK